MSIKININGKMVDMKDIISGGTYNSVSRAISGLNGAGVPYGNGAANEWSKPHRDFGIKINGTDLKHYYDAPYKDFNNSQTVAMPYGVTALKVICKAGGGGGGGGACQYPGGNGGTAGGGGGGGGTVAGYIPVNGEPNFYVEVGGGGSGANILQGGGGGLGGKRWYTGNGPGGHSYVQVGNSQIVAEGGSGGEQHQPGVRHGYGGRKGGGWQNGNANRQYTFDGNDGYQSAFWGVGGVPGNSNVGNSIPQIGSELGKGGQGGNAGGGPNVITANSMGKPGTAGMCRVYYLY